MLLWGQLQMQLPIACVSSPGSLSPPKTQKGFKPLESDNKALLLVFLIPAPLANSPADLMRCFLEPSSRA